MTRASSDARSRGIIPVMSTNGPTTMSAMLPSIPSWLNVRSRVDAAGVVDQDVEPRLGGCDGLTAAR